MKCKRLRLFPILASVAALAGCGGGGGGEEAAGGCQNVCYSADLVTFVSAASFSLSRNACIIKKIDNPGGRCLYTYDGESLDNYQRYFLDSDGDGFGNAQTSRIADSLPIGFVANDDDCDDSRSDISPDVAEIADGIDNNCDGQVDEIPYYRDADGDSFGDPNDIRTGTSQPTGYVTDSSDCDDTNAAINPAATEAGDGIDNNCDGVIDEGYSSYYRDSDGDSFGDRNDSQFVLTQPAGFVGNYGDCDDSDAAISPGVTEIADGIDNNCNGYVDESLGSIPINDTGITRGGNYPSGNNATCIGETIAQQDCFHGRDAEAAAASLTKVGSGHAGFDFTKLDSNGVPLSDQTQDYATLPWACVRDNNTGLVWETKTTGSSGTHANDRIYKWGGKTARLIGEFGASYESWDSLVDGSNSENLCGFSDWRLPSVAELMSIVDYDGYEPSVDPDFFPFVEHTGHIYWSGAPHLNADPRLSTAWVVNLFQGLIGPSSRSETHRVMLVRNEP